YITRPSWTDLIVEGLSTDLFKSFNDFHNSISSPGSHVEEVIKIVRLIFKVLNGFDMGIGQIQDMNIISYTSTVWCIVVVPKDRQLLPDAYTCLRHERNKISRHAERKFADLG